MVRPLRDVYIYILHLLLHYFSVTVASALSCVLILYKLYLQTIRELGMCLDDPKRLVRRQAVISRSRWFLFGAPGDPHNS